MSSSPDTLPPIMHDRSVRQGHQGLAVWALLYFLLAALLWCTLYAADKKLIYVHAGSDLIYAQKFNIFSRSNLFPTHTKYRVLVMGNSKTLSAFRPDLFDENFNGTVSSFNMALPGDSNFIKLLTATIEGGNRPTHVLLQTSWNELNLTTHNAMLLKDDKRILNAILPFRKLPRDFVLFCFQARQDGFGHEWDRVKAEVDGVEDARGWYFIRAQSHYSNNRLPSDFALPDDHPTVADRRKATPSGALYDELAKLANKYHFKVLLVPHARRTTQSAQTPDTGRVILSKAPYIATLGPLYWRLDPSNFSDPVHMNIPGSELYTHSLANLLALSEEFQ
jgi:hypothetical protein